MTRHVLDSYLRRRVALQITAVLAMLVGVLQLLEMLDATTEILERGQGLGGIARHAALRLPAETMLALPLAALIGTAIALQAMARHFEITTMRAAGVGLWRLAGHLLPVVVVLAVVQLALSEALVPAAENALAGWWQSSAPEDRAPARRWTHTNRGALSIDRASADGRELAGVRLYVRDGSGLLEARVSAAQASWHGQGWRLIDVAELRLDGAAVRVVREASRDWRANLDPADVVRLGVERPRLAGTTMAEVVAGSRAASQPLAWYLAALYRSFTAPLGLVVMVLLALPIAATGPRGSTGRELAIALVLGLAFLLADGLAAALGGSGRLSPLAAALVAPVLFIAVAGARLARAERA